MRTWILCADEGCAKILLKKDDRDDAHLYHTIPAEGGGKGKASREFVRYVSEEINLACGAGTNTKLIICAEKPMLGRLLRTLSDEAKNRLVGIIGRDLCHAPAEIISQSCREVP